MLEAHGGGGEGGELSRGNDLSSVLPLLHGLALDLLRALLRAGRHHLVSAERTLFSHQLVHGLDSVSRGGWMLTKSGEERLPARGSEEEMEEELHLWRADGD